MKQLADTLNAMTLNGDLPKEPHRGLTTSDGRTSLLRREHPLTQNQLMQIVSNVLQKPPLITLSKRKVYGRKTLRDEFGEYTVENEPTGEEECFDVSISIRENAETNWLEACLRKGQPKSILQHLLRLSIHKRLGSSDDDRAILLNDYAEALADYSEFVVFLVCKNLWENSDTPFYPKIKPMKDACREVEEALTHFYKKKTKSIQENGTKKITSDPRLGMHFKELDRKDWLPIHHKWYVEEAEKMAAMYAERGDTLKADEWTIEAQKRAGNA